MGKKLIIFNERVESGHIQHSIKCTKCGLHFNVFSWFKDWNVKVKEKGGIYCPECGNNKVIILDKKHIKEHIYEVCPGMIKILNKNQQ